MEVLDTSIANVALPYMAGGLGAATMRVPGCSRPIWFRTLSSCRSAAGWPACLAASAELIIVSAFCLVALVIWEWRHKTPIIDVRLFRNFSFAAANVMMFIFGVLLFSSLVMMPQFLQTVLGYTAENAGLVLPDGGLVVLLEMPVVGKLAGKYPAKYIIASGWLALAIGMYVSTIQLDTLISFQSAAVLRVMQSVGLGLLFVPVTMAG